MPPTTCPESSFFSATAAAHARGKLAPQSKVGGSRANKHRLMSTRKVSQGVPVSKVPFGRKGNQAAIRYAVQAMPAAAKIWLHPNVLRAKTGPGLERSSQEAPPLPSASPIRNTARMIENT